MQGLPSNDKVKNTFITLLEGHAAKGKNVGATYQKEIATLFHDMKQKEIEANLDDCKVKK